MAAPTAPLGEAFLTKLAEIEKLLNVSGPPQPDTDKVLRNSINLIDQCHYLEHRRLREVRVEAGEAVISENSEFDVQVRRDYNMNDTKKKSPEDLLAWARSTLMEIDEIRIERAELEKEIEDKMVAKAWSILLKEKAPVHKAKTVDWTEEGGDVEEVVLKKRKSKSAAKVVPSSDVAKE